MKHLFRLLHHDRGAAENFVALLIGGASVAGLAIGGLFGFLGGADLVGEPVQVASAATASFYDCPDGDRVGTVTRGDRVFITGRDDSGSWVQVRSPAGVSARAWIRAAHVLPDASIDSFPVLNCHVPVQAQVVAPATETTTTEAPPTTDTTAAPAPTTVTTAAPAPPPPPSVNGLSADPTPIWEKYPGFPGTCPGDGVANVTATVSAPAGVQSVTFAWSGFGQSGSGGMTSGGGSYMASIGPFDANDPSGVPQSSSATVTVTVNVTDTLSRTAQSQTTVTLNDCTFG